MAKRSKTVRHGRGQRGGLEAAGIIARGQRGGGSLIGAEGGELNPHPLPHGLTDGGTRRYGRTKRRGSRRGRGQRGGGLSSLIVDRGTRRYRRTKRRGSRRGRGQRGGVDEYDAKAKQFIRGLPTTEKPAFASKYTELKKIMGSEAAFNKMMSLLQSNSANDTNVMEHYGVSLDDKPPVSANVPYSSNDSSLSSLYQHYGLT